MDLTDKLHLHNMDNMAFMAFMAILIIFFGLSWALFYLSYRSMKKSKGFICFNDYFIWLDEQKELERKQGSDDMGDLSP